MRKLNKFLLVIVSVMLVLVPSYAYANNEGTSNNENTGEVENQNGDSNENNNENSEEETENKDNETESDPVGGTDDGDGEQPAVDVKISLDKEELEISTGKTATLKAMVTPSDAEVELEWSSSKKNIATVKDGVVTAGSLAGEAVITVKVKGTDIEASCTVTVTRYIGKDASLKSLTISNGKLDKEFKSDVLEYSVTVDATVKELDIEYELTDDNASYFGPSNTNIKNGDELEIKVIAEDGTTKRIYILKIIKDETTLDLKKLEINGYALNESFDPATLKYTASIPYEIETISVVASPVDDAATVKVSGLTNLKVGANTVVITVKDESGNTRKYEIVVTREKEVSIEEKPTSIITSSDATTGNDSQTSSDSTPTVSENVGEDDNFLKYAIVSLACLILFAIGGIGIYFYLKTSPKKLKKELQTLKNTEQSSSEKESLVVVNNVEAKQNSSIVEVMQEDLVQTREFNVKDLENESKPEDLFDDNKDV